MGNWFNKKSRGLIVGIWVGNTNLGDVIGYIIADIGTNTFHIGWQYTIFVVSGWLFIMSIIDMIFLQPYPQKVF